MIIGGLGFVLRTVLLDPVRDGRLRDVGWPPGMRGIVAAAGMCAALLLVLTAAGPLLRGNTRLVELGPQTVPAVAIPVIATGLVLATGSLYAGLLHIRPVVRVPGLLLLAVFLLQFAALEDFAVQSWPIIAGTALLIAFAALRWRRSFSWVEYAIALALTAATLGYLLYLNGARYGAGLALNALNMLSSALLIFAGPFAVLAGVALAEVTAGLAIAVCTAIGDRAGRAGDPTRPVIWAYLLIGLLLAGRVVQMIFDARSAATAYRPGPIGLGLVMIGLLLALIVLIRRSVRGAEWFGAVDGLAIIDQWRRWALLIAALLVGTGGWNALLVPVFRVAGLPTRWIHDAAVTPVLIGLTLLMGLALVGIAVVVGRRDGRVALVLIIFGAIRLLRAIFQMFSVAPSVPGVLAAADLVAVVMLIFWMIRREVNSARLTGVTSVLAITLLYEYRQAVTEPLVQLLALSGVVGGLLVGAVWRLCTDNGFAAGDSTAFPRPARVLLVIANAVFGVTAIAMVSAQGGLAAVDLAGYEDMSDKQLGLDLIIAVLLAILADLASRRQVTRS